MANGGDAKSAMEKAYLSEQKQTAIARGDLREDGMVVQGGIAGALGFGDTGLAYKKQKTGTDELDAEYRQTFEYSKRKAELMNEGKSAEEADLAVIAEQNQLYQDALTLRLKQSEDYKETFDKVLKETKDIKKAEEAGLKAARENKKNTMTTTQLMKAKFTRYGIQLKILLEMWADGLRINFLRQDKGCPILEKQLLMERHLYGLLLPNGQADFGKVSGRNFQRFLTGLNILVAGLWKPEKQDWAGLGIKHREHGIG
jgi:hypothetical protein